MSVFRCYSEKKPGFDVEARGLCGQLREQLGIDALEGVRILNRYDADRIAPEVYEAAKTVVFSEPQVDAVQSTWNDISKLDIPSLTDLDDATLTALYGIDPADLDSYLCKMPMVNVQATEFFIAKVKDGKMDTVKAAVEKRQDDLEAQWSQYLPEQLELVQNYKLVTNGNYILFAVSEYADEAVTAFNTYTK